MLISQRFSFARGIRFTLPFRETITIGASRDRMLRNAPRRCVPDDASHCREHAAPRPGHDKARCHGFTRECRKRRCMEILENQSAGIVSSGTGNEGVGEHVRTRFHLGLRSPVKLRTQDPHRTKKTCFFCRTGFREERTLRKYDPAV